MATDVNPSTLEVAHQRRVWPAQVSFVRCDAFALDGVTGEFDAALAAFFWSHVPLDQLDAFVGGVVNRVEPGSLVVVADNNYVEGSNHPIARTDPAGNTYQRRVLTDGTSWEVLKNFPGPADLESRLGRWGRDPRVVSLTYYWLATFRTPQA